MPKKCSAHRRNDQRASTVQNDYSCKSTFCVFCPNAIKTTQNGPSRLWAGGVGRADKEETKKSSVRLQDTVQGHQVVFGRTEKERHAQTETVRTNHKCNVSLTCF